MVPVISADRLVHCLPYFPLWAVSPNIISFSTDSELCIICLKYLNVADGYQSFQRDLGPNLFSH